MNKKNYIIMSFIVVTLLILFQIGTLKTPFLKIKRIETFENNTIITITYNTKEIKNCQFKITNKNETLKSLNITLYPELHQKIIKINPIEKNKKKTKIYIEYNCSMQ